MNWPCQRLTQTCMWHPYERGHFSFCEPPRSPPLEGTSLHRRNSSVERPWGIWGPVYHPFPIMSEFTLPEAVGDTYRHVRGVFVKQVVFLTVNHSGPLPLRELHSTGETIVWRDPGGFWAHLRPVSDYEWIHPSKCCRWHAQTYIYVCGLFVMQVIFLTVYHRGPLPLRELHSTDEKRVWRDPGGSWACLRPVTD